MSNGISNLTNQITTLPKDVANAVETTGSLVVAKASDAKDLVLDKGGDALKMVTKAIKDHPIAAIGIAFGVGYVAMRLIRR